MPARGRWFRNSGKPQGCVCPLGAGWRVLFKSKSYRKTKSGFHDRASAEQWRRRKSNKHLLTRNRIRRKVGHPGVREMMIHQQGRPWTGEFATFDVGDLPNVLAYSGCWYKNDQSYVMATISGKNTKLCNVLNPPPLGMMNDHINRVYDDDRRANLRFVTHQENDRNQKKNKRNASGENGISEVYMATFHSYDHAQGKWSAPRGVSTSNRAGRDLRKEAETFRDRLRAKTKRGGIPRIRCSSHWSVRICERSVDGGTKHFAFDSDDVSDRQRSLLEAITYRDRLQTRCGSTNGKPAAQT